MTVAVVLSILSGLISLLIIYARRRRSPTIEERKDDITLEATDTLSEIHTLRKAGDHAGAESLLRKHMATIVPNAHWVPDNSSSSTNVQRDSTR